jgi:3-phosphoshikimate 1-carboxyvinyltransferase
MPGKVVTFQPGPLQGSVGVPGDKSISHRALIAGAACAQPLRIANLNPGRDVQATREALISLGARIEASGDGVIVRAGRLHPASGVLDCMNSGSTARMLLGACSGAGVAARFDGDASLRSRPMRRILDPLALMGAKVGKEAEGGRLPLTLEGARDPAPITYRTPVASAQIKSAVLLAGLAAPGVTTVIEQEASRDHTELMLRHFGAEIVSTKQGAHGRKIALTGQPELHGADVVVPADPSSAAFPLVAALIVEGSDIALADVMTNPLRTGLFTTLREMGASIEESEVRGDAGEPMARLRVRASKLRGIEVPPERAPSMIDEYLVLAVAAAYAEGTTIMRGLKELRVKESDRLAATAAMLRVCGVPVEISGDDLIVEGRGHVPGGGVVATHMDHRIAMSALVMGLASDKPVKVDDTSFIATSFPDFIPMMRQLGADFS